jgi:hypothetical protein
MMMPTISRINGFGKRAVHVLQVSHMQIAAITPKLC